MRDRRVKIQNDGVRTRLFFNFLAVERGRNAKIGFVRFGKRIERRVAQKCCNLG